MTFLHPLFHCMSTWFTETVDSWQERILLCVSVSKFSFILNNLLSFQTSCPSVSFSSSEATSSGSSLVLRTSSAAECPSCRSVCCAQKGERCCRCPEDGPHHRAFPVCVGGSLCIVVWCPWETKKRCSCENTGLFLLYFSINENNYVFLP